MAPAVKVSDIVLYVLPDSVLREVERPAIVVDVPDTTDGLVSLVMFLNGRHDDNASPPVTVRWQPSVAYGANGEPGTWHPVAEVAAAAQAEPEPVAEPTPTPEPAPAPAPTPVASSPSPEDELAALRAENARLKADAAALERDIASEAATPGESSAVAEAAKPQSGSGI